MKFFAGFITSVVIIALTLTGIYAYKELKPNDNDSVQSSEQADEQNNQSNETPAQQTDNEQTAPTQQEDNGQVEKTQPTPEDLAQDEHSKLVIDQHQKQIDYMKQKASEGASADDLHSLQLKLEQFEINNADVLRKAGVY